MLPISSRIPKKELRRILKSSKKSDIKSQKPIKKQRIRWHVVNTNGLIHYVVNGMPCTSEQFAQTMRGVYN